MLSAFTNRIIAGGSCSLLPCIRVLQTSAKGAACQGIRETPAVINCNPFVSTSWFSRSGILAGLTADTRVNPSKQYHHFTPTWVSSLQNSRSSWAALASKGRFMNQIREESGRVEGRGTGDALLEAVRTNKARDVARLIKEGVDPNHRHFLGWTALMVAAINKQHRMVKILLEAGADPNAGDDYNNVYDTSWEKGIPKTQVRKSRKDEFSSRLTTRVTFRGCTALHYATMADDPQTVRMLLEAGAKPLQSNSLGHTARLYAEVRNVNAVLQVFMREFPIEKWLKEHIIGQEEAINTVASVITPKVNGWHYKERPIVFLFLGSSGTGKTAMANEVARYMHKDIKKGFIHMNMSEFQEDDETVRSTGSLPIYVGHKWGQLANQLRECPNAVVLFDDIDMAHPSILAKLLLLLDEGCLTDSKGKTIECKDAIFIMTSNIAGDEIAQHALHLRKEAEEISRSKLADNLEEAQIRDIKISQRFTETVIEPILQAHHMSNQFQDRIDEIVYFLPFRHSEVLQLVIKELNFWAKIAKKSYDLTLTWERPLVDLLASAYDIRYGARTIRQEVYLRVIKPLIAELKQEPLPRGWTVYVISQ